MRDAFPIRVAAVVLVLICPGSSEALAAGQAWVSSSGSDSLGCGARSAPCGTFQYAHDQFDAFGGEIDVADSGSYGGVNISKPLKIISRCAGAFIQGAGVRLSNGADVVIDGVNISNSSSYGVSLLGNGKLTIRNSRISDSSDGGLFLESGDGASSINIVNSAFERSGSAVIVQGSGSGSVQLNIINSTFSDVGLTDGGGGIYLTSFNTSRIYATLISNRILHAGYGIHTVSTGTSSISTSISDTIISESVVAGLKVGARAIIYLNGTSIFEQTANAIQNNGDIQTISNNNRIVGTRSGNAIRVVSGN